MTALPMLALAATLVAQQVESASTAESQSPEVKGADVRLLREVRRIATRVEELRGQRFERAPLAVRASDAARSAVAQSRSVGSLGRDRLAARGRAWADVGLGSKRSAEVVYHALASDLEGIIFDADSRRLLVSPERLTDRDFDAQPGSGDASTMLLLTGVRPDEPLVSHLLMHVRQTEREGSEARPAETTDELLTRAAWAEGEANLLAIRYLFSGMEMDAEVIQSGLDPGEFLDGRLLPDALARLAGAEATLLRFAYLDGFGEAVDAYRAGGWPGLDGEMERRRTTRDLMHPGVRPPAREELPASTAPAPGLQLIDEDSLGEQGIYALVSFGTGKDNLALLAAEGWAGDRLSRWERDAGGGDGITEWVTLWVSQEEAREFEYAYGRTLAARFPRDASREAGDGVRVVEAADGIYRVQSDGRTVRVLVQPPGAATRP